MSGRWLDAVAMGKAYASRTEMAEGMYAPRELKWHKRPDFTSDYSPRTITFNSFRQVYGRSRHWKN